MTYNSSLQEYLAVIQKASNYSKKENWRNIFYDCQVTVPENSDFVHLFFITFLYRILTVKWYMKLHTKNYFNL